MKKFIFGIVIFFALISIGIIFILDHGVKDDILYDSNTEDSFIDSSFEGIGSSDTKYSTEESTTEFNSDDRNNQYTDKNEESDKKEDKPSYTDNTTNITAGSSVSLDKVEDIISNLLSIQSVDEMDRYLSSVDKTSDFVFMPVVNKDTRVTIEYVGRDTINQSEFLAIVTLRQDNGISKFSVTVKFEGTSLKSFIISRF